MARKNKDYRIVTHILSYCVDEVVTGDIRGLKNFCESYLSRNVNL